LSLRLAEIPIEPQLRDRIRETKKEMTYSQFLKLKLFDEKENSGVFKAPELSESSQPKPENTT